MSRAFASANFLTPPMWQSGGSLAFLLGTADVGRDALGRLIYGARLPIGVAVVTLSLACSIVLGLTASFACGWWTTRSWG